MNSPYAAVQYYPDFPFHRLREPSSRLSWRDGPFLGAASHSQSTPTAELLSQDVFNQLFDMLDQSTIHSVYSEGPTHGSAGNTIQISMDCITMHQPDQTLAGDNLTHQLANAHGRVGVSPVLGMWQKKRYILPQTADGAP
ncbi:tumor protein 63-like [Nerophis lumbriciformis]|uniref:tumor protein 63-like n=1 Tax=Nerophis lumbriciformis TaxID=546530 RepID=UPI002ADFB738|nr:tumor protein 63-like [Nerophis lumbriciformis]